MAMGRALGGGGRVGRIVNEQGGLGGVMNRVTNAVLLRCLG
jgi:hypothetical protein